MEENYQVVVHGLRDEKVTIGLCSTAEQMQNMTVTQLKEKIAVTLPVAADKFMLIYADHVLDDDSLLCEYGIQHMSVILIIVSVEGWRDDGKGTKLGRSSSMEVLNVF